MDTKRRRVLTTLLSVLLGIVVMLFGALLLVSSGQPQPFLGDDGNVVAGSISEKLFINVNGGRQGMFIKGKDKTQPVLLYLHGGVPDYFLTQSHPTRMDQNFTVVWWEQRGSGISYSPDSSPSATTVEQLIADTLTVTDYLRSRFNQDKIYLMGHSGGSFVGIQAATQSPERFHAYIGIGQMSDQLESESMAYEYMLGEYRARGNNAMLEELEAAPVTKAGAPTAYLAIRDKAMHELGIGTTHEMRSLLWGLLVPSLLFREYTLVEKLNLWRAKSGSGTSVVWDKMVTTDLKQTVPEVAIPVYFLAGQWDYTCNSQLARAYFDVLKAPIKGFYTFDHSAHSPMFEEPGRLNDILLRDVLIGRTDLADALRQPPLLPTR